ncbi:TIGR04076 family protein [Candidatus Peregrinibacteria bacterium]|nr:TIGR04076 family protein [Candidatus Peregrinibacteria bacterium]
MPSSPQSAPDVFTLFNLRVSIDPRSTNIIGKHVVGDYFDVIGEDIFLPEGQGFSLYALASILPLLPAKQRKNHPNDFMETDDLIADPDVNSGAVYHIARTGETVFRHSEVSGNVLPSSPSHHA